MQIDNPFPPLGYAPVQPGKIATVVTMLEMLAPPVTTAPKHVPPSLSVQHWQSPDVETYRALYRAVGEEWLWATRILMADEKLAAILNDPLVEIHALIEDGKPVGLLELDFRQQGECEIVFFGLVKDAIGKGAGRYLMNHGIATAWSRPINRLWLHTCHTDSPQALPFYQRTGFKPFKRLVEIVDDPRVLGVYPKSAAQHLPLL